MTHEEELELCLKMGVREDWAELILKWLGGKNQSALPMLRLLRSICDYLQYYEGGYADWLKKAAASGGRYATSARRLIERGATPEEMQDFALYHVEEAIDWVMERLSSQGGESKVFEDEAFSECGRVGIVEIDSARNPTGKHVTYPPLGEYTRWFKKGE